MVSIRVGVFALIGKVNTTAPETCCRELHHETIHGVVINHYRIQCGRSVPHAAFVVTNVVYGKTISVE
jgi:hypothetical protein